MDEVCDLLVIVDPTAADQPAVEKAGILAAKLRANVELLACDTKYGAQLRIAHQGLQLSQAEAGLRLREWLESLAAPLRARGIAVRTSAISGDPLHESLLNWIHDAPADIVIKDTHHHPLAKRTFLGNTDWHLIRDCKVPLLLVKPTRWREPPALAAAIDPADPGDSNAGLDRRILECTLMLASALKAQTHVVHAYFPAMTAAAADARVPFLTVTPELIAAEKALATQKITAALANLQIPAACVHVQMGVPSEYLPSIAEECRIDVLVMGANARGALARAVIGSSAERVLEHLPCDVLVVKLPDFSAGVPL